MKPSEILRRVKANPDKECGICTNYTLNSGNWGYCILEIHMDKYLINFHHWEHFSGVNKYPIPAHIGAGRAYETLNKWDRRTKYGQLRWQLLDWLIEQFEAKGA